MTARLARLLELRRGGFDVTRIASDNGSIEVSLHRRGITVVLRLDRQDARMLLSDAVAPDARTVRPHRLASFDPRRP